MVTVLKYTRAAGVLLMIASVWALGIALDGGVNTNEGVCFESRNAGDTAVCQGLVLTDATAVALAPVAFLLGVLLWVMTPRWRANTLLGKRATRRRRAMFDGIYWPEAQRTYIEHWNDLKATATCKSRHRSPGRCLLAAHGQAVGLAFNMMRTRDPVVRAVGGIAPEHLAANLNSLVAWANLTPAQMQEGVAEGDAEKDREQARRQRTADLLERAERLRRETEGVS